MYIFGEGLGGGGEINVLKENKSELVSYLHRAEKCGKLAERND